MTVDSVDINAAIERVNQLLQEEKDLSPAMVASIEILLLVVTLLVSRLVLNSRNNSKPPSSNPNREKNNNNNNENSDKKNPGEQTVHNGPTLMQEKNPDLIKPIEVDQSALPAGNHHDTGYESRQVVDIRISWFVA